MPYLNSAEVHQIFHQSASRFQEIAERMFGTLLLEAASAFDGGGEIAGIDLVEYRIGGRRQVEFRAAERTQLK